MSLPSHFALFSLPERYHVNVAWLETKYRTLVQTLHPDRQERDTERTQVLLQSAALNEAYRVLKDPDQRAAYLLKLRGSPLEEEDPSEPINQAIWMDVLNLQDDFQEAVTEKNTSAVQTIAAQVEERMIQLQSQRAQGFADWEQGREASAKEVRDAHSSLQYYKRLQKQIQDWLAEEER